MAQNWENQKVGDEYTAVCAQNGVLLIEEWDALLTHTAPRTNPKHPRRREAGSDSRVLRAVTVPHGSASRTSWERPNDRGGEQVGGKARGVWIPAVWGLEGSGTALSLHCGGDDCDYTFEKICGTV